MTPYDAILVPGARLTAARPGPALAARLEGALTAYNAGLAPYIVLCGGYNEAGHNEADAMRRWLLDRGVPESALLIERTSTSTRKNLQLCRASLDQVGARKLLAVTQWFHGPRVRYNARQCGLDVTIHSVGAPLTRDALRLFAREFPALLATLFHYPMRRGEYKPGLYHRVAEMRGKDGHPMHPQITRNYQEDAVIMGEGVTRKTLARGGGLMVCEVRLLKGAHVPRHSHEHEQVTYVLSGSIRVHTDTCEADLEAGDSIYFPPGAAHAVTALTHNTVVTDSFTPQREDFL